MNTVSADLILIMAALPESLVMKDIARDTVSIISAVKGQLPMPTVLQVNLAMLDQAAGPLVLATPVLVVQKKALALTFLSSQRVP